MKKFLRVFRTEAEYLEYTASTEFNLNSVSRCREGSLVFYNPADCGGQGIHRTISGETYCDGYDKRVYLYKQVSYDNGETWETTATTSSLVEKNSEDCGYVPPTPPSDWDITAKFNVASTSNPTRIASATTNFSKIEIDGIEQQSVATGYTFSTTGEHTVKYLLVDKTNISSGSFGGCYDITNITLCDSITSIGNRAFYECGGLTSIIIPNNVTNIGEYVFYLCSSLESVTIGSGVTSIGRCAFMYCSNLTTIVIPDSVTSIGQSCFSFCTSLRNMTIGNNVTNISNRAFIECYSLSGITIPNSVTSIGDEVFDNCISLASIEVENGNVTYDSRNNCNAIIKTNNNELIRGCNNTIIPNTVTSIGGHAFYGCRTLTNISIPASVTSIKTEAFRGCIGLTSIDISSGVTSIGNSAFSACTSLTSIDIPDSVTSIDVWAFNGCSGMTSCTIGSGVTTIGGGAFYNCTSLTSVTVKATTPPSLLSSNAFNNTNNCTIYVPCDSVDTYKSASGWSTYASRIQGTCWDITAKFNVTSTSSPTRIANLINNFSAIEIDGVVQPSVVSAYTFNTLGEHRVKYMLTDPTSIGYNAFQYCRSLTSIDIPSGVTIISGSAFYNCSGLTSIDIPSGVTSIGYSAFYNCSGLTSITIDAETPPTLGNYAFDGTNNCPIYVPSCESVVTYMNSWSTYANRISVVGGVCGNMITYATPSKLSETTSNKSPGLHTNAFSGSSGQLTITSHEFGNGVGTVIFNGDVTSVGNYAFYGCSGLTSIDIPSGVTSIGQYAFMSCRNITSMTLYATTPPTLGVMAFDGVNNCVFYVPSDSVNAYKTASGWSSYASRIQAIP